MGGAARTTVSMPPKAAKATPRAMGAGASRDPQLVDDARAAGVRKMDFLDALNRSRPMPTAELPGWPHPGERVTSEYLRTLKVSGLEWISHHHDFVSKSGIAKTSGITRAHRRVSESLAFFMQWDQIDLCNSAGAESLIRFLLAIESAVRRNPRVPDFSLFDEIAGHGLDEVGGLQLPGSTKVVADAHRNKAHAMKQQRFRTEPPARWTRPGDGDEGGEGGGESQRGNPRGGVRAKARARGGGRGSGAVVP